MKRQQQKNVTLNKEKCEFKKESVKFLGHVINKDGVSVDPEKSRAIVEMEPPNSVSEVQRFLGMVNQLGKFHPNRGANPTTEGITKC